MNGCLFTLLTVFPCWSELFSIIDSHLSSFAIVPELLEFFFRKKSLSAAKPSGRQHMGSHAESWEFSEHPQKLRNA